MAANSRRRPSWITRPIDGSWVSPGSPGAVEAPRESSGSAGLTTVLDGYVHKAPSGQNAIDIFRGEWNSKLPPPFDTSTGPSELFDDRRITWALELIGGAQNLDILELGPLEAGHTTMLEQAGAASIIAVEANACAYLKCLVVKETLGLKRCTFLCGDLVEYLRSKPGTFDLCIASGVLYHLREPAEALHLMSRITDRLLLWTHYYEEALIRSDPLIDAKFGESTVARTAGVDYVLHRYEYGEALNWQGFSGGSSQFSNWMSRADILSCLRAFGYNSIETGFDHAGHQNGPAFAVLAQRQ